MCKYRNNLIVSREDIALFSLFFFNNIFRQLAEMSLEYDDSIRFIRELANLCQCTETHCSHPAQSGTYEWSWDTAFETPRLQLDDQNLEVKFHPGYSVGTAAIRGNKMMSKGRHHYWEVKMITPVYGTDVMVGVGTKKADLTSTVDSFCSLLGRDNESWGYSYRGFIQHSGQFKEYAACFKQGSLVGVHLDTWKGTLQFFLNRKPLGIAFTGLRGLELYPMVCSTAAKSRMKITYSCSVPASLQMECLAILRPIQKAYLNAAFPGLKYLSKSVFAEILQKHNDDDDHEEDYEFPSESLILDDFDFALVGCQKKKKKRRLGTDYISELPHQSLKALVLESNETIFQ